MAGTESLRRLPRRSVARGLADSPWAGFLARRAASLLVILAALVIATFAMIPLIPGSAAVAILGVEATTQEIEALERQLGLDRPLGEQFLRYVGGLAQGDLGTSLRTRQPVSEIIAARLPHSAGLAFGSLTVAMLVSVVGGILAGVYTRDGRHSRFEVLFTGVTSILGSVPQFLAATFLAFVFAVWLRLLPVAGTTGLESLLLPVVATAIAPTFLLIRIVRLETLNVLAQDYIRTARSKRLPPLTIYVRHVLPNVLTAAVTYGGILFASIVGGGVLVENVFNRLGMGTTLVGSLMSKDYPVIQGIVLVLGVTVVAVNAVVDVLLALIDPRTVSRHH